MFVGGKSHMHESRGCRGAGLPKNFNLFDPYAFKWSKFTHIEK